MTDAADPQNRQPAAFTNQEHNDKSNTGARSGWVFGVLIGVVTCMLAIAPVRYTLLGQIQFALSEHNSLPSALTGKSGNRDIKHLDRVAALAREDYLIQVGRATELAMERGLLPRVGRGTAPAATDNTLYRLGQVVQNFPDSPGAYAHLARYMMGDRIRIERPEVAASTHERADALNLTRSTETTLTENGPTPPTHKPDHDDLRMMEWALRAGERRDSENGFWPTMLAVTYFAAGRDIDAEDALERGSKKASWDAYIYEEVLGQWRLYAAAYGDISAIQKIGPLSLVSFPHLREIRKMAQCVRRLADTAVLQGHPAQALRLRREIEMVGSVMRNHSQWAYEALIGADVCITASTDSHSRVQPGAIRSVKQWEPEAADYVALIVKMHRRFDLLWLHEEIESSCNLKNRIDLARFDRSYPGIPPGIPLTDLFGSWMAGVCVVQHGLILVVVFGLVSVANSYDKRRTDRSSNLAARMTAGVITASWMVVGFYSVSSTPSATWSELFLVISTFVLIMAACSFRSFRMRRPQDPQRSGGSLAPNEKSKLPRVIEPNTAMWLAAMGATIVFLIAMFQLTPFLSTLHPVAAALTSLVYMSRTTTVLESYQIALVACGLPLLLMVALTTIALVRNRPIVASIAEWGYRASPAIAMCLVLAYLVQLNRTIMLDAKASRALSEAAQNDLQWVLTHSSQDTLPAP